MPEYIPKGSPDDKINISIVTPISFLFQALIFILILLGSCYLFLLLLPGLAAQITPFNLENRIVKEFSWEIKVKNKRETQPLFEKLRPNLSENLKNVEVSVMKSSSENAFALPGNQILITQGFLDNAVYENEKLFVLAHELGHLHYRHPLKSVYRSFLGQMTMGLLGSQSSLAGLTSKITALNFSRSEEKKADLFALDVLYKSTGNLKGAFNFFRRMKKKHGKHEGFTGSLFSTHPVSSERIEYLVEAAKKYSKK